ncbi:hypothetical protein cypCar_00005024 [Cyprinus carpio]|nr:hypothetical protein cypCar_00005024 [Cyprinus carpio]
MAVQNSTLSKLQSLNGIFAIYKKQGPTSADVLNTLKKALLREAGIANPNPRKRKKQLLKIGHGGTLDSNASGVLDHITKEAFEEQLKQFTGEIMQVPPLYSALKKDGQRMSVLLKQGQEVEAKPARSVTVYSLSLQDFSPPCFTIDVECGGGFYVRSLVDDLAKALSSCAHIKELTRTKQGQFTLEEHALKEDRWTWTDISQALQPCPKPSGQQKNAKKAKSKHMPTSSESEGDNGDQND